jgi:hypothetical protein
VLGESLVIGVAGGALGVGLGFAGAAIITTVAPNVSGTLVNSLGQASAIGSMQQLIQNGSTAPGQLPGGVGPVAAAGHRRRDRSGRGPRHGRRPCSLERVAIARALVKNPTVLLADEPTGNLDENTRHEIIGLLGGLWRERGLTFVVVTHGSSVARRAERIAVIRDGRVTATPRARA